ncbi:GyrI-like domain-containing protein [Tunturiibacter lichenicola]|jgi:predicted transcriptional regulator YdeE|uniref:GyrI-like domain-containing protein n=1 Tax=Tunturiibacter lichenicola TaxID=2051959 RepID=UPI003D9AD880
MNIEQKPGFYVVGLSTRTQNAAEMNGNGKIGEVWQRFLAQNLAAKIPNKLGVDLIAIYTNYETDHTGHYTYLLGVAVSSTDHLPPGLTLKHVPDGRYAVLRSNRGAIKRVVPELWQRIWAMSPSELGGSRAFQVDYEVYDQRAADPDNAQIEVHVGLR